MKYSASIMVDGWVEVEVEAESGEEARKHIDKELEEMDFGELRDVAWQFGEVSENMRDF